MADFDPPGGGGGSSEWTDTGSNVVPTGGETIGDGGNDANLGSLSTGEVSRNVGHDADRLVFKDGSDTVVVNGVGKEVQREADAVTALQNAVDNLPDGVFRLARGTYTLTSQWLIRDATIIGTSKSAVTLTLANGTNPPAVVRGYNGSRIESVTIDGNAGNNTSGVGYFTNGVTGMEAENVVIKNTAGKSIEAGNGTTDVTVKNCELDNGIRLASGSNGSVEDCTVTGGNVIFSAWKDGTASGNRIVGDGTGNNLLVCVEDSTEDITFANNTTKAAAGNKRCITVGIGASDATVTGNTVSGADDIGIDVDTVLGDGTVKEAKTSITGNTVRDCGTHGINIQNDPLVTVSGNTITDCERGIGANATSDASDHHTITGNTIKGCPTYGISVVSDSGSCGNNTVTDCGDGIRASGDEVSITGNVVTDNSGTGVLVSGADDVVGDCIILRNTTANLDISGANTPSTSNNITT